MGADAGEDDDVEIGVLVEGGEGVGEFGEEIAGESIVERERERRRH